MTEPPSEQQKPVNERFQRLQSLFRDALALPNAARRPFLEQACAGDSPLLNDVLGMLDEDESPSLLDQTLPSIAHRVFTAGDTFGTAQIGAYRLLRMLGEGGMGVVYLAERIDVGNLVAVKVLRDAGLSPGRRERFLSEQRLLAPLNHPNIARFYDAGTLEDGTPWFAMEYIEGIPVVDYCRKHQSTVQHRLRLLRDICSAVQYAHEHAVIHRDLKPSNVLVKEDGEVKLLDFGIAKQLTELGGTREQTRTLLLLTPAYAAPEQIRGGMVGVFTDIYALGVILYQLLTNRLPFDFSGRSPGEVEQIITDSNPEKPSLAAHSENTLLATPSEWADLNVLCLTALKKETQRRYRSAEAFGRDIDHFLENRPLEARAESTPYRLRKFVRRNYRSLVSVAFVVILIVTLVTFFLVRLTHSRNEALAQAQRSERIDQFMQHLFQNGEQAGPSVDLRAIDLLERGVQEAQNLASEPAVQGELYEVLGESYQKLGKYDRAVSLLQSAIRVRRTTFGENSKEVAESFVALGSVLGEQGKYEPALKAVRQGIDIQARTLPAKAPSQAASQVILGRVLEISGDNAGAIQVLKPVLPALSAPDADPSALFLGLDALGTAYFENGEVALAQSYFERALALGKRIYSPNNPLTAEELVNLGSVQFTQQNFPAAEHYYRDGLAATKAWYGNNHVLVATESRLLGQTLAKEGHPADAEVFLKQALAIHQHEFGDLHGDAAQDLNALGFAAEKQGHLQQAKDYFNQLLRILDNLPSKEKDQDRLTPIVMFNLSDLDRQQKRYSEAEDLERKALKLAEERIPPNHLYTGVILLGMGKVLVDEKHFQQAEPYLEKSCAVLGKQGNPSLPTLLDARKYLVTDYRAEGKSEQANSLEKETVTASNR
jgi:eukaryotic-like serine/threonine-protein kinase